MDMVGYQFHWSNVERILLLTLYIIVNDKLRN